MIKLIEKLKSETMARTYQLEADALSRYKFSLAYSQDKDVLDIGTGLGHGASLLSQGVAKKVVGIDYSLTAIKEAQRRYIQPNLQFICHNMLNTPNSELGMFDVAIAYEIIEHLTPESVHAFLSNIKQVLRVNGQVLLSTPNKLITSPNSEKPNNPYHLKEYTPEEYERLLKKYFSNVKLLGIKLNNSNYLEKRETLKNSIYFKLIGKLSKSKTLHEFFAFVPKPLKKKLTRESTLPTLSENDFTIWDKDINKCDILLAVCTQ